MSATETIAVGRARVLPRPKPFGGPDVRQADIEVAALIAAISEGVAGAPEVYSQACPLTYCVFDISPALAVAQSYITDVLGVDRVVAYAPGDDFGAVERQLKPGVVAFFTPDQMEMFPDGWFDCAQTISRLPEMPARQSAHYLELLAAKSGRAIFLKQWLEWRNAADAADLREQDYALPGGWQLAERRIDPIQPAFFNHLWLRADDTEPQQEHSLALRS